MENTGETQGYTHENVLERLSIYDNTDLFNEAREYYIHKYGNLAAIPPEFLSQKKAKMVSSK